MCVVLKLSCPGRGGGGPHSKMSAADGCLLCCIVWCREVSVKTAGREGKFGVSEACGPGRREDTSRQRGSGSRADFPPSPINPFDVGPVAEGSGHSWWVYLGFPQGFPPLPLPLLVLSALHASGSTSKLNMCCLERERTFARCAVLESNP